MNAYEPLNIFLNAPKGKYAVTLTVTAHCDTVFSITETSVGVVCRDRAVSVGDTADIVFDVDTDGDIDIEIRCDGDLTATAMAEYVGE